MTIHRKNNITYFTFPELDLHGVVHGIFMRHGGISEAPWTSLNLATSVGDARENVIENRRRITDTLRREQGSIYDVWQVHSNTVSYSASPRKLDTPHLKADAILTDNPDTTLMMLFADCVPILLYDPVKNVSGLAHAGWQGTANKVVSQAIKELVSKHGCQPESIIACIGPSICARCYQVGENVLDAINDSFSISDTVIIKKEKQYFLNLQAANQLLLEQEGVKNVFQADICTAENARDWFSHRAENGETGRFGAVMTCEINLLI